MHSMTGFGRGTSAGAHGTATVEISCVNRKQAEVIVQGARDLQELEARIRKRLLRSVSRGRFQVSLQLSRGDDAPAPVKVDLGLTRALDKAFVTISEKLERQVLPEASDFLRVPGLIQIDDAGLDPETAWQTIEPALESALGQLLASRAAEGAELAGDLAGRLARLDSLRESIAALAPARAPRQRELLLKRLGDAGLELDLDDERVLREVALFADRCDISEELTRLECHFKRFTDYLHGDEAAGRPLDFLCQEIHREFNTIGSKASDAEIAQAVVSAKSELEKIREQVQNVE